MLARELEIRIVAEGVEDAETWAMLSDLGCDLLQGYWVSKPVSAVEFRALLPGREVSSRLEAPAVSAR
jgi:EAL domain-containing protein (putative c-di-GMP-specific phosphodiesterase class I)